MQKHKPLIEKLFPKNYQLIDGTDEIFELDLALWEYEVLSKEELLNRSAYLKLIDNKETTHFKTCNLQNLEEIHKNSSFRTKMFFLDGKYSTGYATHSLFPYRGKFHPQLIRALLNVLQIKQRSTVLDPMAGSATLSVEANLLGINLINFIVQGLGFLLSIIFGIFVLVYNYVLYKDLVRVKYLKNSDKQLFVPLELNKKNTTPTIADSFPRVEIK